jgi:hypothetical protein
MKEAQATRRLIGRSQPLGILSMNLEKIGSHLDVVKGYGISIYRSSGRVIMLAPSGTLFKMVFLFVSSR